jgi:pimeloyl-ACP methyl ester carboxylesterase
MRKSDRCRGGISEKVVADINGVRQGMFMQGTDVANPVILYLHGGMPEHFLAAWYPHRLDDLFTLAWWEERGAGLSYSRGIPRETLTAEQLVADTLSVTEFLRVRFGKEKIYLMAHSGGTFIGLQAAVRAPALFAAYIGVAQVVHQLKSEMAAHEYLPDHYLAARDKAMHRLGVSTAADMTSVGRGIFWPPVLEPGLHIAREDRPMAG